MTTIEDMDGYSVAAVDRPLHGLCYRVYKHNIFVATISKLEISGKMAFEWHTADMWKFRASDFVR